MAGSTSVMLSLQLPGCLNADIILLTDVPRIDQCDVSIGTKW